MTLSIKALAAAGVLLGGLSLGGTAAQAAGGCGYGYYPDPYTGGCRGTGYAPRRVYGYGPYYRPYGGYYRPRPYYRPYGYYGQPRPFVSFGFR